MQQKRVFSLMLVLILLVSALPITARAAVMDCEPYANVEYGYSQTVEVGTIRYIQQMPKREYFHSEYWPDAPFGGYSDPTSECGAAVISMALSYVGVNKTPEDILRANNGYTYFDGWGPTRLKPTVSEGMDNYLNGNGKYSPVIIRLHYYTGRGHYVILAGRISENVYLVLDPVKSYTWEITVHGTSVEYLGQSDTIDGVTQYYNPDAEMGPPVNTPPVEEHECDKGEYLYYYAQHPHFNCYRCSVCGEIWVDTKSENVMDGCPECQPGVPALTSLKDSYPHQESVLFHWQEVEGAVRYSLQVCKKVGDAWEAVIEADPAEMGLAMTFEPGKYRARVTAHVAGCQGDETECPSSQYHYFTVVEKWENPFTDVVDGSFYCTPALWAYWNGITTGVTDTAFVPNGKCTRAQVVTFLWRLAGSPAPESRDNPFTDVSKGNFYYKAALWAAENGITKGVDDTHFAPDEVCTRAQVVTFLWRAAGKPAPADLDHAFTDVRENGFYFNAVLWAVESGITKGVDGAHFAPDKVCTRAQVVTFLYRCAKN